VEGMSGALKPCPRCKKAEIRAKRLERWLFPNWYRAVTEHSRSVGMARMILIVLAIDADKHGRVAIPRRVLANRCGCRQQTITDNLLLLERLEEIKLVKPGIGQQTAVFRLLLPAEMMTKRPKHAPDVPGF
jgi:hypothetical protein